MNGSHSFNHMNAHKCRQKRHPRFKVNSIEMCNFHFSETLSGVKPKALSVISVAVHTAAGDWLSAEEAGVSPRHSEGRRLPCGFCNFP